MNIQIYEYINIPGIDDHSIMDETLSDTFHPITAEMLWDATVLGYLYLVYCEYNVPPSINNMFQACSPHYLLF